MKAVCIKGYYDKVLHRTVTVGEELELDQERFGQLSTTENDSGQILVEAKKAKRMLPKKEIPEKKGVR